LLRLRLLPLLLLLLRTLLLLGFLRTLLLLLLNALLLGFLRTLLLLLRLLGALLRFGLSSARRLLLRLLRTLLLGLLCMRLLLGLLSSLLRLRSLGARLLLGWLRALLLLRLCTLLLLGLLSVLLWLLVALLGLPPTLLLFLLFVVLRVTGYDQSYKQADHCGTSYSCESHVINSYGSILQARRMPSGHLVLDREKQSWTMPCTILAMPMSCIADKKATSDTL